MKKQKAIIINMREVRADTRKPIILNQTAPVFRDRRQENRQEKKVKMKKGGWDE